MAVYKIFPDKDSFIFTEVSTANAGYDEMIEIGGYPIQEIGQTARTLIHFKNTEIQSISSLHRGMCLMPFDEICKLQKFR